MLQAIERNNEAIMSEMRALISRSTSRATAIGENASPSDSGGSQTTAWGSFFWGGRMGRITPENWTFPVTPTFTMWMHWHYGHEEQRIRPYKNLTNRLYIGELSRDSNGRKIKCTAFSKARKVMDMLQEIAVQQNFITAGEDITQMDKIEGEEIFHKSFEILIRTMYADSPPARPLEMLYTSLANKLYDATKPTKVLPPSPSSTL